MHKLIKIPGFVHIKWADVKVGDKVWLQGVAFMIPKPYGSYVVFDKRRRELQNVNGNVFMHMAEDLILPIPEDIDEEN